MSYRIPIGPAAALFEEGAYDMFPAPAERVTRFADTPVAFIKDTDAIRLAPADEMPARPTEGRKYH
ncbi:hypothetical protein [Bauldia litoralis]|uniref:Uncharacterized protein n=1 Tax=Bauldia litoralis TaxID=665467 RepID=A0A1G6ACR1_9HYPH|nr:hypothetical protein [Bauldia litoralis]SDB06207.1 hypothetical protein SAMN02982931_00457 [Bauldia litoralis]